MLTISQIVLPYSDDSLSHETLQSDPLSSNTLILTFESSSLSFSHSSLSLSSLSFLHTSKVFAESNLLGSSTLKTLSKSSYLSLFSLPPQYTSSHAELLSAMRAEAATTAQAPCFRSFLFVFMSISSLFETKKVCRPGRRFLRLISGLRAQPEGRRGTIAESFKRLPPRAARKTLPKALRRCSDRLRFNRHSLSNNGTFVDRWKNGGGFF